MAWLINERENDEFQVGDDVSGADGCDVAVHAGIQVTEITLKSGRKIGPEHPAYIVAEVGSNWTNFHDCAQSITKAKLAGADAVKFQAFSHRALYGLPQLEVVGESHPAETEMQYALPVEWLPKLKEKADACGIDFMCTAFSPEILDAVDPHVEIHKVASAEITHVRLLERIAKSGKPVIVSTGASGEAEVLQAMYTLRECPVILMYCVASYPAHDINLKMIPFMKDRFRTPMVGYSDHSNDVGVVPFSACQRGAVVLEKHFTAVTADTPDQPHSLDPEQFKRMVTRIREGEPLWFGPSQEEHHMLTTHNRRLIATKPVAKGQPLVEGQNFGIYRSLKPEAHAFSPWLIERVNGRAANRDIAPGDGIGPGDV